VPFLEPGRKEILAITFCVAASLRCGFLQNITLFVNNGFRFEIV
jgi:hypothetical protein